MRHIEKTAEQLVDRVRSYGPCMVAFSGGVDSTVVCKAAVEAFGDDAMAVTAVSPSLASGEREQAELAAQDIGIAHRFIVTGEIENEEYVRNGPDRCFHCKSELYSQLELMQREFPLQTIVNGANADDTHDFRPGMRAAVDHRVRSPLAECHFDKATVRELAKFWNLSVWDKPAMPCLASRIAYGQEVTPERLQMIDRAEDFLRKHVCRELRVRYHAGDLARIEVPEEHFAVVMEPTLRRKIDEFLRKLGFKFVTLELSGFQSGNLNVLIPVEQLLRNARVTNVDDA